MSESITIKSIQFKRGTKAKLEARLIEGDQGIPKAGEPIFETDSGKLKIGDGVLDYAHLPYLVGSGGGGEDDRFLIVNPLDGQVLLYDSQQGKWVNKDLADEDSIIYLANHGLTLKGYDQATQGQMLVKDTTNGLAWVNPLSQEALNTAVTEAQTARNQAGQSATAAGNSAIAAHNSEVQAAQINQQTMSFVNGKFWWGTLSQYNALPHIEDGTFYFITAEE